MAYDPEVFNVDPYYDDYDDNKKFLRVVYKPGYAVQARELTQSQTILQKQIQRFGDHIFKDGSIVSESQVVVNDAQFVRISGLTGYAGIAISNFDGLTATVSGKNTIRVINTIGSLSGSSKDDSSLLFFSQYLAGATGFDIGDTVTAVYNGVTISATVTGGTSTYNAYSGAPNSLPAFGDASVVGVDSGVRYIKGYFVNHDSQKVTPYNTFDTGATAYRKFNELDSVIKFDVTNTIVTATDDASLNDPAFGSYNYAAPGADRYRIDLTLNHVPLSATADYTLVTFQDGEATYKTNYPEYNVLADTLARRTYDESGNYTLDDFPVDVEEITGDANEGQLKIRVGKGKAYVFGYEFVNYGSKTLTADKARTIRTIAANDLQQIPFVIGNTVNISNNSSLTANIFDKVDWNGSPLFYISSGTSGAFNKVGTVRIGKYDAIENSSQVHLYDLRLDNGITSGAAKRLFYPGYTANDQHLFKFQNDTLDVSNAGYNSLLFPLSNDVSSYAVRQINGHAINIQRSNVFSLSTSPTTVNVTDFDAGSEFAVGDWMDFNSAAEVKAFSPTGAPVAIGIGSFTDQSFTITAGSSVTATVFVNIEVSPNAGTPFARTKTSVTETASVSMTENSYEKFAYINGKVDVYKILSITGNTGGSSFAMNDYFSLDNGQRDDIYDWSRIVLKKQYFGAGVTGVSVTYKRYDRAVSSAPFLISSYGNPASLGLNAGGTGAAYKEIPVYNFQSGYGKTVSLSGCLDARPDRITPSAFTITSSPFDYGATGGCKLMSSSFEMAWDYYQPRTDKIVLTRDREFRLIAGISGNDQAPAPQDIEDAMTIGTVTFHPYTKSFVDTTKFLTKNRRYTMRDIGTLEKRIDRLEYYTTLSLQEKDAKSLEIRDANGLNKFKNGIFVDSFVSRTNSDYTNRDHSCAVDPVRQEVRPRFITKYADFSLTGSVPSGLTFATNGLALCNYTTQTFVQQKFGSKAVNVNPFDVTNFNGSLNLTPSSDDWVDVRTNPDIVVNIDGQNDGIGDLEDVDFGTVWNNWETTWTGAPVAISPWRETERSLPHSVDNPNTPRVDLMQRVTSSRLATQETAQTRSGTRLFLRPETVTRNVGNRIVDVSIVPFMRAATIAIKADGMRPNVRVYPFFDGTNATEYFSVGGVTGAAIITDSAGRAGYNTNIVFNLPSGVFRTGERLLRLIDSNTNSLTDCTTSAEQVFRAQGLIRTEEGTVVSTRNINIRRESVTEDRVFNNTITENTVRYVDPVAQTFLVDPVAHPAGIFVKSINIYFKTKAANLPITLQLRPAVNGYPSSSNIIPFSEVNLLPADVNTSDNGSAATTFTFENPVYVQPGEYAMVLLSNSNEYEVWVSEVGQADAVSQEIITSQPYGGSFFKSQNSSTWTAEQALDLKFDINKCVFDTSGGTLTFKYVETDFDTSVAGVTNGANIFRLNATHINPPSTSIGSTIEFEVDGSQIPILSNENLIFATKKSIKNAAEDTMTARLSLSTSSNDVSPALDLQRVSGLYVQNLVNTFNDSVTQTAYEQLPSVAGITNGSASVMRYLSRRINLQDGFESNDVDVYLTARLPKGSEFDVYMKSQSKTDNTRFEDLPYEKMTIHPNYEIFYGANSQYLSVGEDDYVDLRFTRGGTGAIRTSGITGQSEFRSFQIKVVMYGDYTNTVVPAFKDLKVIAT
jgi:hypothetical protein